MGDTSHVPEDLITFLETTSDVRAYRRGLAVKMALEGYVYRVIADVLHVTIGFVSHAKKAYSERGIDGLQMHYTGKVGYLSEDAHTAVRKWIQAQESWSLPALKQHILQMYGVTYKSDQSYYALFAAAGITYKQAQAVNPKKDPEQVAAKKKELTDMLVAHADAIQADEVVVLFVDQCHLVWKDACGYVWGPSGQRITVPMTNSRERQTYYGAINPKTRDIHSIVADCGNGYWTTIFVTHLCELYPHARIILCWDGASYHRGEEMRTYLEALNYGQSRENWRITCFQFAPHAPEQNPIEEVWLKAKTYMRQQWQRCTGVFTSVTMLFEEALETLTWEFEKLFMYTPFLQPN